MCIKKRLVYCFMILESKWCLSLDTIPFALFNFCFKNLIWCLKSTCLSIKTPPYLVQVFCLIFWSLKWKFIFLVICFLGDRKIAILLTFKAILFARSRWIKFDRSKFFFFFFCQCLWQSYWHIIDLYNQQIGVFSRFLLIDLGQLCISEIKGVLRWSLVAHHS